MTQELISNNDNLGEVADNVVPPGLPPAGVYNSSITPAYSYNPDAAAQLLIQAMQNPITSFNFVNGTRAPAGLFNNTFGCKTFANGVCANPVSQTVPLVYGSGDTADEAIFNDMAGTINNISTTYNMGLNVVVQPLPTGQMITEAFSEPTHLYMYALGWIDDYPWVLDFTGNMLAYPGTYPGTSGMNFPAMNTLYQREPQRQRLEQPSSAHPVQRPDERALEQGGHVPVDLQRRQLRDDDLQRPRPVLEHEPRQRCRQRRRARVLRHPLLEREGPSA